MKTTMDMYDQLAICICKECDGELRINRLKETFVKRCYIGKNHISEDHLILWLAGLIERHINVHMSASVFLNEFYARMDARHTTGHEISYKGHMLDVLIDKIAYANSGDLNGYETPVEWRNDK